MEAEGTSVQRTLRAAYHVAAAAVFRPRQSQGSTELLKALAAPSHAGESPASPEARLVEVQVDPKEIRSSPLASRQGANCWASHHQGSKK